MTRKTEPEAPLKVEVPGGRGTITMRRFTSREFIAMKRGNYADVDLMEMTVAAIVDYLPGKDPLDLPPEDLLGLTSAWLTARSDEAIPPPTA